MSFKLSVKLWLIYFLLAFPLFYFVFKYGTPDYGLKDFYSYYELYKDWNIKAVDAPFNMRLLGSFFVYLFHKIGINYETTTAFDKIGLDRQVFFDSVFFNMLCVVSTCVVIYKTIFKFFKDVLLSFIAGCIYLFGFGTLFYELMPITDALSIFIFALVLYGYLAKKYWIIIPLILLIIQREYIYLALGLICVLDYWKYREKYFLHILFVCIGCFAIYYVLRKTIFYTPAYDHQASPTYFLKAFTELRFPLIPYIKQTIMTMNVFIIYVLLVFYKKRKKLKIDTFNLAKLLLLFLQINVISFAAVFGNNTGRYFYILVPLVIFQLMKEIKPLLTLKSDH